MKFLVIHVLYSVASIETSLNPMKVQVRKALNGRYSVQVREGYLLGSEEKTASGLRYVSFLGIPYAEPPLGNLRFEPPVSKTPWKGVREAEKEGPMCPQFCSTGVCGEEDCLYLNIYTSQLPNEGSSPLKTMVYIHGGGFRAGSALRSVRGPDYFLEKGVIVVALQYRLGVLGFLSLQNYLIPGNMGLKDQNLALKWIKDNIGAFGGDASDITVFGESAGAASVHYHILSPKSQGLFERAIAESGSALNPWALTRDARQRAVSLSYALGCVNMNDYGIIAFLKAAKVEDLILRANESLSAKDRPRLFPYEFVPCVEPNIPGAFLTEDPSVLVATGRYNNVPYLTGINSAEANILVSAGGSLSTEPQLAVFDKQFVEVVAPEIRLPTNEEQVRAASNLRKFYFGERKITAVESEAIVQMFSDLYIGEGIDAVVRSNADVSTHPLYYYRFSFKGAINVLKDVPGVTHADELLYIFRMDDVPALKPGSSEAVTRDRLVTMWTNFAIYGNATPHLDSLITINWPQYTKQNPAFLDIGTYLVPGLGMRSVRQNFLSAVTFSFK